MTTSKKFISPSTKHRKIRDLSFRKDDLFLVDQVLLRRHPSLKKILPKERLLSLKAGEKLKTLSSLESVLGRVLTRAESLDRPKLRIVCIGGGSLGDFSALLASLLYRGVPIVQVPTTWISAVDSAFGGKTALNIGKFKNQIGSFWPAERVLLCQELLEAQPQALVDDAYFEFFKMALLSQGAWGTRFIRAQEKSSGFLWRHLHFAVAEKLRVVKLDPYDRLGKRAVLNLGHTLGHALELEHKLGHGQAVGYGLDFALHLSAEKKLMSKRESDRLRSLLGLEGRYSQLMTSAVWKAMRSDKKRRGNGWNFVLLKAQGKPRVEFLSEVWLERRFKDV